MSEPWLWDPVTIWFLIGLVCVIAEFALPGVIIVFFGAGAWFTALVTWLIPIGVSFQVALFSVSSILALVTLRKRLFPAPKEEGESLDEFVGKTAEVVESVSPEQPGKVRLKGALWQAETQGESVLEPGRRVRVTGRESITLFVRSIEE